MRGGAITSLAQLTLPVLAWDAVGFLCQQGAFLAHVQSHSRVPSDPCSAAFQIVDPPPALLPEVIPPEEQSFAFPFEHGGIPLPSFPTFQGSSTVYQPLLLAVHSLLFHSTSPA